jgi:hypothetical protein
MNKTFQNVRAYIAGLVGNPNVSEGAFAGLDSAMKADEASMEALLAVTDNPNQTAEVGNDANVGTAATIVSLAAVVMPAVADVIVEAPVVAAVAVPAVVAAGGNSELAGIMSRLNALEAAKTATDVENVRLSSENQELRAVASPRSVVPITENLGTNSNVRVSRTAEKDARHAEEVERLRELYPGLMDDIK